MTSDPTPRIIAAIRELDYDFSNFTLRHFIDHVRSRRERPLAIRGFAFDGELPGGWVKMPDVDFVFYDNTVHQVQQIHTLLHEVGHIVLNHKPYPLEEVLPLRILDRLPPEVRSRLMGQFRQPTAKKTPQECLTRTCLTPVE